MESGFVLSSGEWIYLFLFAVSIVAGIVDAIAGGGGLITIPCLVLSGLPLMTVLGTNKLQAVVGELTTTCMFIASKEMPLKGLTLGIISTSLGALSGACAVSLFEKETLEVLLPVLMMGITIYSVTSKRLEATEPSKAKLTPKKFMVMCGVLIGFYNGFFGPGTGSFWMLAFVVLLGYTIKQASMTTKPLNLVGNIVPLVLFIILGQVDYTLGLIMGVGQIAGSIIGSKFVISHGTRLVRPVFISVTMIMTAKLIYENVFMGWFV